MFTLPYNITCGYYDSSSVESSEFSTKRETTRYEIEFYLEDGLSTYCDDKEYIIKKHYIQIAKPAQVRYSKLPFKTIFLKFSVEGKLAERLNNAPEYFCSSHPEKIIDKADEIILLNENKSNELLLYSRLLSFLNLVLYDSEIPKFQNGQSYEIISKAKRFIEKNYMEAISLNDIAKSVNLSPIYFHNIFTKACGISPHKYLMSYRIGEAKKQLWNNSLSIQLIAENCGFGCQQYFNKIFKKETGVTPGKYRKEFKQSYFEG